MCEVQLCTALYLAQETSVAGPAFGRRVPATAVMHVHSILCPSPSQEGRYI